MFGKKRERLRQWSLLGLLLNDRDLASALEFMEFAFGATAVKWALVRKSAAQGRTLLEASRDDSLETPPEVLGALEAGEADGRLPQRLVALVPPIDSLTEISMEEAGVVALVNRLIGEAIAEGAAGMLLLRTATGEGELKVLRGEVWTPHSRYGAEDCASLVRRLWFLSGQPYWSPKAGVIRVRTPEGTVELRVTPGLQGGLGIELVTT